jgi:hypothetical protein
MEQDDTGRWSEEGFESLSDPDSDENGARGRANTKKFVLAAMVPDLLKSLKTAHTHSWVLTKNSADEVPQETRGGLSRTLTTRKPEVQEATGGNRFAKRKSIAVPALLQRKPKFVTAKLKEKGIPAGRFREGSRFTTLVKSERFQNFSLLAVLANVVWIGFEVTYNHASGLWHATPLFVAVEFLFFIIFNFELCATYLAYTSTWVALHDRMFIFDVIIVAIMNVELLLFPYLVESDLVDPQAIADPTVLRTLRLLRLLRAGRIIRKSPELATLLRGTFFALRSVSSTLALLGSTMYIFSIFFMTMLAEHIPSRFGGIASSFTTLLFAGTFLDEVDSIASLIWEVSVPMWLLFNIYIILSSVTYLNMLIAILVDVFGRVSSEYKDEQCARSIAETLHKEFEEADWHEHATVSFSEFSSLIKRGNFLKILDEVGVDVPSFLELAETLYMVRRGGGRDSVVDTMAEVKIDDLVEIAMNLRTENAARVRDVIEVRKLVTKMKKQLKAGIADGKSDLSSVQETLDEQDKAITEVREMVSGLALKVDAVLSAVRKK